MAEATRRPAFANPSAKVLAGLGALAREIAVGKRGMFLRLGGDWCLQNRAECVVSSIARRVTTRNYSGSLRLFIF